MKKILNGLIAGHRHLLYLLVELACLGAGMGIQIHQPVNEARIMAGVLVCNVGVYLWLILATIVHNREQKDQHEYECAPD